MSGDSESGSVTTFSVEVGRRLRGVRRARRLSLDDVERESGGRWSASAIGAYERGFRNLSLPRLRELAEFYDVPMSMVLGEEAGPQPGGKPQKVVVDLEKLESIPEAEPVTRYLRTIVVERGDYEGQVVAVRRDDVRAMCAVLHASEGELFERLTAWESLVCA